MEVGAQGLARRAGSLIPRYVKCKIPFQVANLLGCIFRIWCLGIGLPILRRALEEKWPAMPRWTLLLWKKESGCLKIIMEEMSQLKNEWK